MDTAREWGPYPRRALKYLWPSHKLLAASPPASHIFTATQTKRDQAGGSWLSGRLVDPAMPPLARQPLFHAPAAGWSSVPHRLLPTPACPHLAQKFLLGSRRGCGGKAQGWRPWVAPSSSLTAPACSNRSLFQCPQTPFALRVGICATYRRPQPRTLLTLPLTAFSNPGLFLVPRHLAIAGRTRDAPASYPGL